jgi:phage RecT family recombinase
MAESLPALLEAHREEIKLLLPHYLDVERFLRNASTLTRIRALHDCSPSSLLECAMDAARRGLEIGSHTKHCAAVPFQLKTGGTTAVLIVQWQGKAFLWSRAGAIRKLVARCVYVGDEFRIIQGDTDRIEHTPDLTGDHDPAWLNDWKNIVGAYAIAWLWSGEKAHSFVSRAQIMRVMEAVKRRNKGDLGFGWTDWRPEMAMKTAVHRLEGFVHPPPDWTPDQIDAWQRAGTSSGHDAFDRAFDVTGSAQDDNDEDLPSAKAAIEAPPSRVSVEVHPPSSAPRKAPQLPPAKPAKVAEIKPKPKAAAPAQDPEDELVSVETQDDLIEQAQLANIRASALLQMVKRDYGVDDLGKLRNSQAALLGAALRELFEQSQGAQ